jgi:type II secretory pathway pseudopilin PulG
MFRHALGVQHRAMGGGRTRQRGEMAISRLLLLVGILLVLLLVPVYFLKDRDNTRRATDAAERAIDARAMAAASAAQAARNVAPADRLGMTFGWSPATPPNVLRASCQGLPAPVDNAFQGGCNTMAGDTSCRTRLPLLCLRDNATLPPALATAGDVAGFMLGGEAQGDALCAAALGADWRMARYGDMPRGDITVERAVGVYADTTRRAWVASRAVAVNCWDAR